VFVLRNMAARTAALPNRTVRARSKLLVTRLESLPCDRRRCASLVTYGLHKARVAALHSLRRTQLLFCTATLDGEAGLGRDAYIALGPCMVRVVGRAGCAGLNVGGVRWCVCCGYAFRVLWPRRAPCCHVLPWRSSCSLRRPSALVKVIGQKHESEPLLEVLGVDGYDWVLLLCMQLCACL
jgi:hypothetical protein